MIKTSRIKPDNRRNIQRSSYLLCVLVATISSCNFFAENGGLGVSLNIRESKERKVYVQEYRLPSTPYRINDSLALNMKSAWLEHMWRYAGPNSSKADIEKDGYQLIIIADSKSLKGYGETWLIGTGADSTFNGCFRDAIITEFKKLPSKDTIEWSVQSGAQLAKSIPKVIVGKFSIVAVK